MPLVTILTYVTDQVTYWMVGCAWAYVAVRYLHSWVHLGSNDVLTRFRVYGVSALVLGVMWTTLLVQLLRARELDPERARALAGEIGELRAKAVESCVEAMIAVRGVLTHEQVDRLLSRCYGGTKNSCGMEFERDAAGR